MVEYSIPLCDADELILEFFNGDEKMAELFRAVAEDMIARLPDAQIKDTGHSIIGVFRPYEKLRFYVNREKAGYTIRYKEMGTLPFEIGRLDEYLKKNAESFEYYSENPEKVKRKTRHLRSTVESLPKQVKFTRKDLEAYLAPLKAHGEAALATEAVITDRETLAHYCYGAIAILMEFAGEELRSRERDIFLNRVLTTTATLRELGETYGISHERVRQLEKKYWKTIFTGITHGVQAAFMPVRERLVELLLSIDASHLIPALAYISRENERVGTLLIRLAISKERFPEFEQRVNECKIDIIEILTRRKLENAAKVQI